MVSATALTYKLLANEKACFFANVENKGAKIAFYFAVCRLSTKYSAAANSNLVHRCNRVAPLMWTLKSSDPMRKY
jgi:hypothetical protein